MWSIHYACHILIKFIFLDILEKCWNIKFHENPSSVNQVLPCGQTEGQTDATKITRTIQDFVNVPKKERDDRSNLYIYIHTHTHTHWLAGLLYPSSRIQTPPKPSDFSGEKILSTPSFGGEVKPSVLCRALRRVKKNPNVTWKSSLSATCLEPFLAHSSTFRCWVH
jgi:hypothetical protein